jgi:nitrite reductase/ring-hydroxylating ferredoxin subunit
MIAKVSKKNLDELTGKGFSVKVRGKLVKGFVVKKGGQFYAYMNVCKHLPVTLDLNDDNFFTFDKAYLQCHMHGAMYEIETGFCVGGPCQGSRLEPLKLMEEQNDLLITVPESSVEK